LQAIADSNGIKPTKFALFHYIEVRDLARFCRAVIEAKDRGEHERYFVGSGETIVAEPLCSLYPQLMPSLIEMAAPLVGKTGPVSIQKARSSFNWKPEHSWRSLQKNESTVSSSQPEVSGSAKG